MKTDSSHVILLCIITKYTNGGAALLRDRISNQISCRPLAHLHVWSSAVLQTLA